MTCAHETTEPVVVTGTTAAQVCVTCFDELPAKWGCGDCRWVEMPRRICDKDPGPVVLGQRCRRHRGNL